MFNPPFIYGKCFILVGVTMEIVTFITNLPVCMYLGGGRKPWRKHTHRHWECIWSCGQTVTQYWTEDPGAVRLQCYLLHHQYINIVFVLNIVCGLFSLVVLGLICINMLLRALLIASCIQNSVLREPC